MISEVFPFGVTGLGCPPAQVTATTDLAGDAAPALPHHPATAAAELALATLAALAQTSARCSAALTLPGLVLPHRASAGALDHQLDLLLHPADHGISLRLGHLATSHQLVEFRLVLGHDRLDERIDCARLLPEPAQPTTFRPVVLPESLPGSCRAASRPHRSCRPIPAYRARRGHHRRASRRPASSHPTCHRMGMCHRSEGFRFAQAPFPPASQPAPGSGLVPRSIVSSAALLVEK